MGNVFGVAYVILFSLAILAIGYYATRQAVPTAEDYFVAGRSIGFYATMMGSLASQMSAFIFMGAGALAYVHGVAPFIQAACGSAQAIIILFVWQRLWELGKARGYLTLADFLADRYDSPGFMKYVPGVLAILATATAAFIIQFMGTGYILSVMTGGQVPFWVGVVYTGLLAGIVIFIGGYRANAWTDTFLGTYLVGSVAIILIIFFSRALGMSVPEAFTALAQKFPKLASPPGPAGYFTPQLVFSWMLTYGFVAALMPHLCLRAYGAKSRKIFPATAAFWVVVSGLFVSGYPSVVGSLSHLIWPTLQEAGIAKPDQIIPLVVTKFAPGWLVPIILAGGLAAIVSTVTSGVLAVSTMLVVDVIKPLTGGRLDDRTMVRWGRLIVLIAIVAAVILALGRVALIATLLTAAYVFVGTQAVLVILGLYWKRISKAAAIWGLIAGEAVGLWLTFGPKSLGGGFLDQPAMLGFLPLIWSFVAQLVVTVVVTYLTQPLPNTVLDRFFAKSGAQASSAGGSGGASVS